MKVELVKGQTLTLSCLDERGRAVTRDTGPVGASHGAEVQCLYHAVDVNDIYKAFVVPAAPDTSDWAARRNIYISYLLSVTDQNCDTFLGRAFANKSTVDTTKNTMQDLLTGTSAVTANASPPLAAGLGVLNLVVGKTVDNVNSTFFVEKAYPAIQSAINLERTDLKVGISGRELEPYSRYTIYDAVSDVRRYQSACSIRAGVSRLQSLADDQNRERKKSEELGQSLTRTLLLQKGAEQRIAQLQQEIKSAGQDKSKVEPLEKELAEQKAVNASLTAESDVLKQQALIDQEAQKKKVDAQIRSTEKQAETAAAASRPVRAVPPATPAASAVK